MIYILPDWCTKCEHDKYLNVHHLTCQNPCAHYFLLTVDWSLAYVNHVVPKKAYHINENEVMLQRVLSISIDIDNIITVYIHYNIM